MEPTEEEFNGSFIAFGPVPWPSVLDQESLATIRAQVVGEDPRLMFHTNPSVGCIAEVPYFAGLLDRLLKEVRKIKELNSSRVSWDVDRGILLAEIEAIKKELQELDSGRGNICLVQDYLQHLQDLTRRWNLLQAIEEDGLSDPQISDIFPGESETGTATDFSVQN